MTEGRAATARAVALAGPYGAGKTTLMEALLFAAGARARMGSVRDATAAGDRTPEAQDRGHSTELNVASCAFMGDRYWLLDTPGSTEFAADGERAIEAADVVVVVADADPERAFQLQPYLNDLDARGVPHMVFVNRIDEARSRARDLLAALQEVSPHPLVMRQIPIWEGEAATGFIDLALERAFVYRPGEESKRVDLPSALADREADARFQMLERLADFDDTLMEQLLEDAQPDPKRIFADLAEEMQAGLITPVFLGSAINAAGVRRLWKALRHETPTLEAAAERVLGGEPKGAGVVSILKTSHAGQAGKVSIARVLSGAIPEGAILTRADGETVRAGSLAAPDNGDSKKVEKAGAGDVVAIGRLGEVGTGEILVVDGPGAKPARPIERPAPVYARAVSVGDRKDEVKLTTALAKLAEEDMGLIVGPEPATGEFLMRGQGEVHVGVAKQRLARKFGVDVQFARPATPYKETIRKAASKRGRHKKQSGGHGQFGDVVLEVKPRARGKGFEFQEKITGGVVPRQYFSAVEHGVADAMQKGPLGFPVIDVAVALVDGSHHSVDSSEIAFRTAGRIGMSDALAECDPVLLEPILKVEIVAPSDAMSRVTSMVSSRRGQILGFDARVGWPGWDRVEAYLPQAEADELIIELRSATQGAGSFTAAFDHMAELTGRVADQVVQAKHEPVG